MLILFFALSNYIVRFMTYPAPVIKIPSPPPMPFKEIQIKYDDQNSAISWLFENSTDTQTPVVLLFHGNGENLQAMNIGGLFHQFMNLNVHFLALDYPGYGRSDGKASEKNNIAAANAAVQWIENNFAENPKIIFGWSLGAAVAIQTAFDNQNKIDGLIAVSAWSSLPDVAAFHYSRWLSNLLVKEKYNSVEAAQKITCPALVMHGTTDSIIPFSQGKKVAEALGGYARWVEIPNTGHNDIFSRNIVWEEITQFLEKYKGDVE